MKMYLIITSLFILALNTTLQSQATSVTIEEQKLLLDQYQTITFLRQDRPGWFNLASTDLPQGII
ncbi:MAG: hypothetical protein H6765_06395 [Candidatus Peribacteria bacterium]|nr:MAG: hypothetical protein H6765_06395 [Candidatus Peribacteria bacterium]